VDAAVPRARGPLSGEGLHELFEEILALTKREVERREGA
jgi:hypothetical protein